jgi:hypothetical protein
VLNERSPMYVPVLTDEDLAADPPGHRSGYVAVIGKPNAGGRHVILRSPLQALLSTTAALCAWSPSARVRAAMHGVRVCVAAGRGL